MCWTERAAAAVLEKIEKPSNIPLSVEGIVAMILGEVSP